MKTSNGKKITEKGFTLIEIIATLVLFSIFGVALFGYFNSSIINSPGPIFRLKQVYSLKQAMENITAYHLSMKPVDLDKLEELQGAISSKNTNKPGDFGNYTVVHNDFIDFNDDGSLNTKPESKNRLRITIKDNLGTTLSLLFATDPGT